MGPLDAAASSASPLNAALRDAVGTISEQQTVTFTQFVRLVLPLDGSVFWVQADILSSSALYNASAFNETTFGKNATIELPAQTFEIEGSLHYSAEKNQDETETYSINRIVFTTAEPIEQLDRIGPSSIYIGEFDGLKFAFSSHAFLYQAAGLWHYAGNAIYPDMETQLVYKLQGFDSKSLVVSNSLPIWLSFNNFNKQPWEFFGNPMTLYPSYLLPANITPPWGAVHIAPESTRAIAAAPEFSSNLSQWQLTSETVKVTMYGIRNAQAQEFADFVQQQAANTECFGIMNQPIIADEKRTQSELGTIAQKKSITYEINYFQKRAADVARQLILSAIPNYIFPTEEGL